MSGQLLLAWALLAIGLLAGAYTAYLDHIMRAQFERKRWQLPARVYASPLEIYPGLSLTEGAFLRALTALGYGPGTGTPGSFEAQGNGVAVVTRPFQFADGAQAPIAFDVDFADGSVNTLTNSSGAVLPLVRLPPLPIGDLYPGHNEDRILLRLSQVSPTLINGLIAVEDRTFYHNVGIDPRAVLRALWVDVRAGHAIEGASTITQQLARNFYLTPARTLRRKVTEAIMALLLTGTYSKHDILDTYLNEVYLGQNGDVAIHGFGLASEFYFGKPLNAIDDAGDALLIGLVRGPSYYNPRHHPQRALRRRNRVLLEMATRGVITQADATAASQEPLGVTPTPPPANGRYPAFLDVVRREIPKDYRDQDLHSGGLRIFTTLEPHIQNLAQAALTSRLVTLDRSQGLPPGTLEGAVIVVDPQTGEVTAVVGGRDPRIQGFNRAIDAARQTGSAIKPAIYLAALESGRYTLASELDDTPLSVNLPNGTVWTPRNYDRTFHGQVLLMTALAQSYNVATVRLGLAVGLDDVIATAHALGLREDINPYPSSLLGASNITPWDLTQLYESIASGGYHMPLRVVRSITTADDTLLKRFPLAARRVAPATDIYLLTTALQDVVKEGTASGLSAYVPANLTIAGKTGTTEDLRDSWFAAFSGNRLAVVWVGRDQDHPTGLTGATGAMTVWGTLMESVPLAPLAPLPPPGITTAWIDPTNGKLADSSCAHAVALPFAPGTVPTAQSSCVHASFFGRLLSPLRRLFGR